MGVRITPTTDKAIPSIKVREAKGMSQKEVPTALKIDASQYSKIENGKIASSFTIVVKIANALGVTLSELFRADEIFTDVKSSDKTLMEKLRYSI